ncbi:MAG: hypothetical protein FWG39_01475 [Alphaproteobacteria bacterium]|nr:hypothetical protein [Alphaproteobacteria bacterium]
MGRTLFAGFVHAAERVWMPLFVVIAVHPAPRAGVQAWLVLQPLAQFVQVPLLKKCCAAHVATRL